MEKANIERINYFSRLARERALTSEEEAERKQCREKYLQAFRGQMRAQLSQTVVQYPDGSRVPLTEVTKKK